MRTFGKDKPEFFCFQLEGSEKVYKIPLAASMTNEEALEFSEIAGDYRRQIEWLRRYMGDAVNNLTVGDTAAIFTEWNKESQTQGVTSGES